MGDATTSVVMGVIVTAVALVLAVDLLSSFHPQGASPPDRGRGRGR